MLRKWGRRFFFALTKTPALQLSEADSPMTIEVQSWEFGPELRRLKDLVNKSEDDGLRARWASGHCLLTERKGKLLPRYALAIWAQHLGVHRSELSARMKFAEKYSTEEELSTFIESFKTWHAIRTQALIDKPRSKKKVHKYSLMQCSSTLST